MNESAESTDVEDKAALDPACVRSVLNEPREQATPEPRSLPVSDDPPMGHAYPHELAMFVHQRWHETQVPAEVGGVAIGSGGDQKPELSVLERLLSVCYQASLLYEEGRPITLRLALGEPDVFAADVGPPGGLHRLVFTQLRPFDEHELRRLGPAAKFHRSLVGVKSHPDLGLQIWGLIHSGPRWLQVVRGGRDIWRSVPPVLMVAITGPGRVLVSKGSVTIGKIAGGALSGPSMDVFDARWLPEIFAELRTEPWASDVIVPGRSPRQSVLPHLDLGPLIAQHVLRRAIATIRSARHGGTLVIVPARRASEIVAENPYVTLKYTFCDEEPRRRVLTLMSRIADRLATLRDPRAAAPLGWGQDEVSADSQVVELNEAAFEVARLIAALADIDGTVVLTTGLELLGFGGEISAALADVTTVVRALDLDAQVRVSERTDRVGTRHRSVFRLCQAMRDTVAIVVSQDGGVRFVRWHDGSVTYWDQIATGPWEI